MTADAPRTVGSDRVSVPLALVRRTIVDVLLASGAVEETAGPQAEQLVEGDLRGHPSHGLQRLPMLVRRIRNGVIDPAALGRYEWRSPVLLAVDGERGLGPAVAGRALDVIMGRATEHGVAVATIANANHLGMLAPLVERAARAGFVCIATTTSEPLVHAWGGREAAVGTNPFSMAAPTDEEPVVIDMSTGEISRGKVIDHANRGEPLPVGAVVDADGNPTTDPERALGGSISPFGGAKGYALAVGMQMLVGALTASTLGRSIVGTLDADEPCNKGDVIICLDPRVATGDDRAAALGDFVRELREGTPVDPERPILAPGDRSREARAGRLAAGRVEVSTRVWGEVSAIAGDLGLDVSDVEVDA